MKKLIISTPTKEDWKKVVQKLLDEGCYWCPDEKEIYEEYWKEGEAVRVRENELKYTQLDWYKGEVKYQDYKFLTAQEFLGEEREFKVGDRVRILSKSNVAKCFDEVEKDIPNLIGFITDIRPNDVIYVNRNMENHQNWTFLKQDLQLLKEDPKCEEMWEYNPSSDYLLKVRAIFREKGLLEIDNLPHEGKIKKMEHYLLRKLDKDKRVLYKRGYYNADLSLTEKGERLLNYILKDEYEKKMADIAREEKEEEE